LFDDDKESGFAANRVNAMEVIVTSFPVDVQVSPKEGGYLGDPTAAGKELAIG
jgi:hypothetical protein